MLIFLVVLGFIFIGFLTLKPVILSHKDNWNLWLMAYGAIAISVLAGLVITNEIVINIIVGVFLVSLALLVYKIVVKKLQYRKLFKATKATVDDVAAELLSGRNVNTGIAYWAIERLEDATIMLSYDEEELTPEQVEYYDADHESKVNPVYKLARNKYAPATILDYLSTKNLGYDIMLGLGENPTTSPEALSVISDNLGLPEDVVDALLSNPNITDTSIGVLAANIDDLHKILSRTSPYQKSSDKALKLLRTRQPELQGIEDRFIIALYSKELN